MKNRARKQEGYFDFDVHFEQNFASRSSLEQAIKATEQNIQKLSAGEYTEFVSALNHARAVQAAEKHAYIPKANSITLNDFSGAVVFPGNAILPVYIEKWGLPPIHLLITLPKKSMESIKKKLGYEGELSQVTMPTTYFPPSAQGLHHTGLTLVEKPSQINTMDFYAARFDAVYYSRGHQVLMQYIKEKRYEGKRLPRLACFAFEYDLLFDMLANKPFSPSKNANINYYVGGVVQEQGKNNTHTLLRRVGISQRTLAQYPASDSQTYKNAFEELAAQQYASIEKVIDALYFIEDTLGSNLIRPVLFATGPTQEELKHQEWRIGPFAMLQAFAFFLSNGFLTKDEVYQKIFEKGYTRISSHQETGQANA